MKWLNGKKSYLGIVAWGLAGLLESMGIIENAVADQIKAVAVTVGGVGIAHKVAKVGK